MQEAIDKESEDHEDILQGMFEESYYNLALKSMSAFKWTQEKCQDVNWLVKVDDDTVNNMGTLRHVVNKLEEEKMENVLACSSKKDPPMRRGKYAVTKEEFSGRNYPTNCFGTFFAFSGIVRDKLHQAFIDRGQKVFKIDDVYVTGILAKEAGVKHYNIRKMVFPQTYMISLLHNSFSFVHMPSKHKDIHKKRFLLWDNFVKKFNSTLQNGK